MIEENKCIEYYFDSKVYSMQEIKQNIQENKKEFPNKIIESKILLNSYGVYVVTLYFKDKNNMLRFIKNKSKKYIQKELAKSKEQTRLEKYYGENRYGQYKSDRIYRPY